MHGFIVVAAVMDDFVTNLSEKVKLWFREMGSREVDNVRFRQGYVFIGINPRNTEEFLDSKVVNGPILEKNSTFCLEKVAIDLKNTVSVT